MKKIFVLKTGATFKETASTRGDFENWVIAGLQIAPEQVGVINVLGGDALPQFDECAGVIVTGSHAMVTDNLPWSLALEQWLVMAVEHKVPIFGICYGHQLLAKALGGKVDYHPMGPEIGCFAIEVLPDAENDPLFSHLPVQFNAHLTHHQSVIAPPADAVVLASSAHEPHQAFRFGDSAWGVQFHPEYSRAVMADYTLHQRQVIEQHQHNYDEIYAAIEETPVAQNLLLLFSRFCGVKSLNAG